MITFMFFWFNFLFNQKFSIPSDWFSVKIKKQITSLMLYKNYYYYIVLLMTSLLLILIINDYFCKKIIFKKKILTRKNKQN